MNYTGSPKSDFILFVLLSEGSALPTRVNPNHSEDGPSLKKKVVKPKVNKNRRGVKSQQDIQVCRR